MHMSQSETTESASPNIINNGASHVIYEVETIYTLPTGYGTLTTLPLGKSKIASDRSESE